MTDLENLDGLNPQAQVRFEALGVAWRLIRAQIRTWALTSFLLVLILEAATVPVFIDVVAHSPIHPTPPAQTVNPAPPNVVGPPYNTYWPNPWLLALFYITEFSLQAFLWPGLFKMTLKQIDGEAIAVKDLFSGGAYFKQSLLALILWCIFHLLGLLACFIGSYIVALGLMFTMPLIVDRNLGAPQALSCSWQVLKPHLLMMFLLMFVALLCTYLGALACIIGMFATIPFLFITPTVVYREFFPANSSPPIPFH